MRLQALARGHQLSLVVQRVNADRLLRSYNTASRRRSASVVAQARESAALRELEEAREERAAVALDASVPIVRDLTWERPLQIIRYPDPRLRAVNARIATFDDRLRQFSAELLEVMYNGDDGVGLAAPQVGVNVRLMVYNPTGKRGDKEYVLVNPIILSASAKSDIAEEGCLSFPRIFAEVERRLKVKVKAQDVEGREQVLSLNGWQARIFQHEYDHLQGKLFHDRMRLEVLQTVRADLLALEEAFLREHPGVAVQRLA